MLSLMRRPRLDAAAAIAATRFGSDPFDNECAMGSPSLDASSTPFNSGIGVAQSLNVTLQRLTFRHKASCRFSLVLVSRGALI